MGFSFRSLYTEDDHSRQSGSVNLLRQGAAASSPSSVLDSNKPAPSKPVLAGIPGPLKEMTPVQTSAGDQSDKSAFCSLDALEPVPDFNSNSPTAVPEEPPPIGSETTVPAPRVSTADPVIDGHCEAQTTLRAVFATTDSFTLDHIAILTAKLPGIVSCIIQTSDHAILATAEQETVHPVETAPNLPQLESFQHGLNLLGLEKVDGVRLCSKTDPVSCFSCGETFLMTRHSGNDLEPGLWEKLILITQAIAGLH